MRSGLVATVLRNVFLSILRESNVLKSFVFFSHICVWQNSMPKKFSGENTKAAAARARKDAAKREANEKKKQEEEDEYWRDDDKANARKLQRKV